MMMTDDIIIDNVNSFRHLNVNSRELNNPNLQQCISTETTNNTVDLEYK